MAAQDLEKQSLENAREEQTSVVHKGIKEPTTGTAHVVNSPLDEHSYSNADELDFLEASKRLAIVTDGGLSSQAMSASAPFDVLATKALVDASLASKSYALVPHFASPSECNALCPAVLRFAERHYTRAHLESHAAYISDDAKGRNSYAFALQHPTVRSPLPAVELFHRKDVEEDEEGGVALVRAVTARAYAVLGLERGRALFNVQRYWSRSLHVLTHRDGEVFEAVSNNRHGVVRSLHPRKVALLTLFNNALHGGTRLTFKDGSSIVVEAQAGDLLVFDNVDTEHGVDELQPMSSDQELKGEVIRQIIGWRAMEWECSYLNRRLLFEPFKPVSYDKAVELQRNFLSKVWPLKLAELRALNKLPPVEPRTETS